MSAYVTHGVSDDKATVVIVVVDDEGNPSADHLAPDAARRLAVNLIEKAADVERPSSAWPDDEADG